jgi:hypothetical protein
LSKEGVADDEIDRARVAIEDTGEAVISTSHALNLLSVFGDE